MVDVTPVNGSINLGRQGENIVTRVLLPLSDIRSGDGYAVLFHQRSVDDTPYPVTVQEDGDTLIWTVTDADTAVSGRGKAEMRWIGSQGELAKSQVYKTYVAAALEIPEEVPSGYQKYVDAVAENAKDAKDAATESRAIYGKVLDSQKKIDETYKATEAAKGKAEEAQEKAELAANGAGAAKDDAAASAKIAEGAAIAAQQAAQGAAVNLQGAQAGRVEAEKAMVAAQEAAKAAKAAQEATEKARDQAKTAQDGAENALTEAVKASQTAQGAEQKATQQAQVAQVAKEAAEQAQTGAEEARTGAETAKTGAVEAQGKAEEAQTSAETAAKEAQEARTGAETAKTGAVEAQGKAEEAAQGVAEDREQIGANTTGLAEAREELAQTKTALETTQKDLAKAQRAIKLQAKLSQGQVWDFEEDTTEAYQRQVPSGAKAGAVMEWGGKTVAWNQMETLGDTIGVITDVTQQNGILTIPAVTATSGINAVYVCNRYVLKSGHKIYISVQLVSGSLDGVQLQYMVESDPNGVFKAPVSSIVSYPEDCALRLRYTDTKAYDTLRLRISVHDLTLMYGPGNEPTTTDDPRIAQIEAYAKAHPEYNAGELVSGLVDEVRVKSKNIFSIDQMNVSDGGTYLCTKPLKQDVSMSIKLKDGKTVPNVAFGFIRQNYKGATTATWFTADTGELVCKFAAEKHDAAQYAVQRIGCYPGTKVAAEQIADAFDIMVVPGEFIEINMPAYSPYHQELYPIPAAVKALPGYGWSAGSVANTIERTEDGWRYVQRVGSRPYQEGDELTDGTTTYYALDTPITTDITALMSSALDPFAVEPGGSITLHHPAGDDGLELAGPAKVQYITKLSEVSANG